MTMPMTMDKNKLKSILKTEVSAEKAVINFYSSEIALMLVDTYIRSTMYTVYNMHKHSVDKLRADIVEYKKVLTERLAKMFFDYSVFACYRELTHMYEYSDVEDDYESDSIERCKVPRRNTCDKNEIPINSNAFIKHLMDYEPYRMLSVCESAFYELYWDDGYGGEAWGFIANRAKLYGKIEDSIYVDMCFSLSHNNNSYIDKDFLFSLYDICEYEELLEQKKYYTWANFINTNCMFFDTRLNKIYRRIIKLGILDHCYKLESKKIKEEIGIEFEFNKIDTCKLKINYKNYYNSSNIESLYKYKEGIIYGKKLINNFLSDYKR